MNGVEKMLKQLMKTENAHQMLLFVVFVVYLLADVKLPEVLARGVDTMVGKVVVLVLSLTVFMATHPLVGVLALVVGYEVIRRSSRQTGSVLLNHIKETEVIKMKEFEKYNDFPKTLEEEVVQNSVPLTKPVLDPLAMLKPDSFKPIMSKTDQEVTTL